MRRLVPLLGAAVALGSLALLALFGLPSGGTPAQQVDDADGAPADPGAAPVVDRAARALLERAAAAPRATSYSGTQYVSAWTTDGTSSQVLQVEHSPAQGTTWRAVSSGARTGAVVRTAVHAADPSILGVGAVALMARHYSLANAPDGKVAGREAEVVEARRPASGRQGAVVARFWLDRETGLVLRREVYDTRGRLVRASAFVDVALAAAEPAATTSDGEGHAWRETLDEAAVQRMRHHGWDCPDQLPGPLPLVDARRGGTDRDIVHLSYADGIASISVFQQRGRLDRDHLDGYRRETVGGSPVWVRADLPRRVVWSTGDTVYTVVADAPERTVDRAVVLLHDGAAAGGGDAMDRLGRGLNRVASWFNPFE